MGSLPGTSAEVLWTRCASRFRPAESAPRSGLTRSRRPMTGHPDNLDDHVRHIESSHVKRFISISCATSKRTGGINEFVPLSFVYEEAPMFHRKNIPGLRPGASGAEVMKMYAASTDAQQTDSKPASFLGEGRPKLSQIALLAGANDFGGTLINESISTAAGAAMTTMKPSQFRASIREMGRIPAERSTTYHKIRVFESEENPVDLLG